jgi:hypothetical protein
MISQVNRKRILKEPTNKILHHFETVISKWKPEEMRMSQYLKKTSFRVRKFDFKKIMQKSAMLKEIDERRRANKAKILKIDEKEIMEYSMIMQVVEDLQYNIVAFKKKNIIIKKDVVLGRYFAWHTDKKDHVKGVFPTYELIDSVREIINDNIRKDDFFEYVDFIGMLYQVDMLHNIFKIMRKEPYRDNDILIFRSRYKKGHTRIIVKYEDDSDSDILCEEDEKSDIDVNVHICMESPTREEIQDLIFIYDMNISVGVYEYVTNFHLNETWRPIGRVPTANEVEHLWHLVYESDVRCENLAHLMEVKNMKVKNTMPYVLYDTIISPGYPSVLNNSRFLFEKDLGLEGYFPDMAYSVSTKVFDNLKGGYVTSDCEYNVPLTNFRPIDESLMYDRNYNRIRMLGHKYGLRTVRLEIQLNFRGYVDFDLWDDRLHDVGTILCGGPSYCKINIKISEALVSRGYKLKITFRPLESHYMDARLFFVQEFLFDSEKDVGMDVYPRSLLEEYTFDRYFDLGYDFMQEKNVVKDIYPIMSICKVDIPRWSKLDFRSVFDHAECYYVRDGINKVRRVVYERSEEGKKYIKENEKKAKRNRIRNQLVVENWRLFYIDYHVTHSGDDKYGPNFCGECKKHLDAIIAQRKGYIRKCFEEAQKLKVGKKT